MPIEPRPRESDAFVAFNPGVEICAELLVVAEDEGANLLGYTPPAWMSACTPDRFWLLAHATGATTMRDLVQMARAYGIGRVYIIDDHLPNPWDGLPTYRNEEVAAIAGEAKR